MEFDSGTAILVVLAFVALGIVLVLLGKGRRSTRASMGAKGVEIETKNEEHGSQTSSIKNVKITGADRTSVKVDGQGSHIEGVEVDNARDTSIGAGKEQ